MTELVWKEELLNPNDENTKKTHYLYDGDKQVAMIGIQPEVKSYNWLIKDKRMSGHTPTWNGLQITKNIVELIYIYLEAEDENEVESFNL